MDWATGLVGTGRKDQQATANRLRKVVENTENKQKHKHNVTVSVIYGTQINNPSDFENGCMMTS